jgi:hypothetical protein
VQEQSLRERAEQLRGAVDEAARLAQTFYLSFLALGTYIAVIIGATTDVQLLKVSPVTLPLLNVPLPIVGFYVVIPWLLLLVYFNLLLHLTFLAQKLHRFNAVLAGFPDDTAREDQRARLFPFPFSALLSGQQAPGRVRGLLGFMIVTTVVLLPLVRLLWAQVRFLPYPATAITWTHRGAVCVDVALLWLFWPLLFPPAPRGASPAPRPLRGWVAHRTIERTGRGRRLRWWPGLLGVTVVTVVFALGIAVLPEEGMEVWLVSHWFERHRAPFHRNLQLQEQVLVAGEPSAKVIAALRSPDESERAQGLTEIAGLILTNRDLRGADFRDAFLPQADLRGANLKGATLVRTRVFAGNFSRFPIVEGGRCVDKAQRGGLALETCATNLQGADLYSAQLQGAYLASARLQGAYLHSAEIGSANFRDADLTWSDLRNVSQSPLNAETYEQLEKILTDAIRNEDQRANRLAPIKATIGQQTNLHEAHASARSVRCSDVTLLPSCLPQEHSTAYAEARAGFLERLGCQDKDVARGVARWHIDALNQQFVLHEGQDPILMVFVNHVTKKLEQEQGCPEWAALPPEEKQALRHLAAGQTPAR